mmetsp:Transcript_11206/g.31653  ORF Transcript_11206/g.31653 Transcript_11206/m.31653 type:complete len:223 (+) Transcript_11206:237-905(+)
MIGSATSVHHHHQIFHPRHQRFHLPCHHHLRSPHPHQIHGGHRRRRRHLPCRQHFRSRSRSRSRRSGCCWSWTRAASPGRCAGCAAPWRPGPDVPSCRCRARRRRGSGPWRPGAGRPRPRPTPTRPGRPWDPCWCRRCWRWQCCWWWRRRRLWVRRGGIGGRPSSSYRGKKRTPPTRPDCRRRCHPCAPDGDCASPSSIWAMTRPRRQPQQQAMRPPRFCPR